MGIWCELRHRPDMNICCLWNCKFVHLCAVDWILRTNVPPKKSLSALERNTNHFSKYASFKIVYVEINIFTGIKCITTDFAKWRCVPRCGIDDKSTLINLWLSVVWHKDFTGTNYDYGQRCRTAPMRKIKIKPCLLTVNCNTKWNTLYSWPRSNNIHTSFTVTCYQLHTTTRFCFAIIGCYTWDTDNRIVPKLYANIPSRDGKQQTNFFFAPTLSNPDICANTFTNDMIMFWIWSRCIANKKK